MITIDKATQPPKNDYEAFRLGLYLVSLAANKLVSPDKDKVNAAWDMVNSLKLNLTTEEIERAFDETDILLEEFRVTNNLGGSKHWGGQKHQGGQIRPHKLKRVSKYRM